MYTLKTGVKQVELFRLSFIKKRDCLRSGGTLELSTLSGRRWRIRQGLEGEGDRISFFYTLSRETYGSFLLSLVIVILLLS